MTRTIRSMGHEFVKRLLDRKKDCSNCGGGIWSGMQALLVIKAGKTLGWFCSDECFHEWKETHPSE